MRRILSSAAVVCLTLTSFTSTASAATITLDATSRGYFRSDGSVTGGHGAASANYLAGQYQTRESRNFFIFDLSSITGLIVSASLQIAPGDYLSPDTSETVTLFDVSTPFAILTNGTGGVAAFNDLGAGTSYGSRAFTAADVWTVPVTMALNGAALTNLQSAVGALFAMGGAVTSLSGSADQTVFGATHLAGGLPVRLVLETQPAPPPPTPAVPEPATLTLLGTGLVACASRWRRRSRA
jgi:hypothetical protein